MRNKMLYLLRGLPGSGKSTLAEAIYLGRDCSCETLEADAYFYNEDGEYVFDATKLHKAHAWCLQQAEDAMTEGWDIIVSNTFTTEKELKPYLDIASEYGYDVTSLVVENRHGNKSIHGVPEETMQKLRNRFSIKL